MRARALAKRTRKGTQVNASLQTRTCVRTCEGWPNGFASRLANRFYNKRLITINLCRLVLGAWPNGKKLAPTSVQVELNQSQRKSTQVVASRCKSMQVGG